MSELVQTFVYVYLPGQGHTLCGELKISRDRRTPSAFFQYSGSYLNNHKAFSIDPSQLPLKPGDQEAPPDFSNFGGIRDASPDGWGRHLLNRLNEATELDEYSYLVQSSMDRVGALAFGATPYKPERVLVGKEKILGEFFQMEDLQKAVELGISSYETMSPEIMRFLYRGSSALGGARPKGSTFYDNKYWIAKFSREDDSTNQPLIEYANMTFAKKMGLQVPEVKYIKLSENKGVFLIQRFDREIDSQTKEFVKRPFISGLTALGAHEQDRDHWGYGDLAEFIDQSEKDSESSKIELYKRLVFNVLCGNTDDHLRNHGFLYDFSLAEWKLSPLYDVVPMAGISGTTKKLFLRITQTDRTASIEQALSANIELGIESNISKSIVQKMVEIGKTWRSHYKECGVKDVDIGALSISFNETEAT